MATTVRKHQLATTTSRGIPGALYVGRAPFLRHTMAMGVLGVLSVIVGGLTVSDMRAEGLERHLRSSGQSAVAEQVHEYVYVGRRESTATGRLHLQVTFTTADGQRVTANATGICQGCTRTGERYRPGWRQVGEEGFYRPGMTVVYDPADPQRLMTARDISASSLVSTGWTMTAVLAAGALLGLLAHVRDLRRRSRIVAFFTAHPQAHLTKQPLRPLRAPAV